jgi:transcription antitermination factor NusG
MQHDPERERIDYYPLRISPTKKVWQVDHLIRGGVSKEGKPYGLPIRGYDKDGKPIGLPTIYPPTDIRMVRRPRPGKPTRTVEEKRAMIPGYVYVGFESWDDYHRLLRFPEVTGPLALLGLKVRGEPYALTPEHMAQLRAIAAKGTEEAKTVIHAGVKVGETVRIADWYDGGGLYAGQEAKLVAIRRGKAEVLLTFFNALHPVKVPVGALEPV